MSSWNFDPVDSGENFNERSEERQRLFDEAAHRLSPLELHPSIWAFLQVGDLERIKQLVQAGTETLWEFFFGESIAPPVNSEESLVNPKAPRIARQIAPAATIATRAILLWKQSQDKDDSIKTSTKRKFSVFSEPATSPSPSAEAAASDRPSRLRSGTPLGARESSVTRSRTIAEACKKRDDDLCVVTRQGEVDACHIYPWCAFGVKDADRVDNFWKALKMFWPADKVDSWRRKIFQSPKEPNRGTETVENMVTLTATMHRFHSGGAFALRPVRMSDDKTQLELEFHWLAQEQHGFNALVDLRTLPVSSRNRSDAGRGRVACRFEDPSRPTTLISGTRFTMETDDPVKRPLPDPGLLEVQWHLQRILAMSGAANWEDDFDDHDALPSVEGQEPDDQSASPDQSRESSPGESVESVDGVFDQEQHA